MQIINDHGSEIRHGLGPPTRSRRPRPAAIWANPQVKQQILDLRNHPGDRIGHGRLARVGQSQLSRPADRSSARTLSIFTWLTSSECRRRREIHQHHEQRAGHARCRPVSGCGTRQCVDLLRQGRQSAQPGRHSRLIRAEAQRLFFRRWLGRRAGSARAMSCQWPRSAACCAAGLQRGRKAHPQKWAKWANSRDDFALNGIILIVNLSDAV